MSVTTVLYEDVAPGAEEAATTTATTANALSDLSLVPVGVEPLGAIITLEHGNWGLDGNSVSYGDGDIAYWSNSMSGADCLFSAPHILTISLSEQFSSLGITLSFDSQGETFCSHVNLKWYQGATLREDMDFFPDSAIYFCDKRVESFDRIVITMISTNLPGRYAKIEHVLFGIFRTFGMDEIRSASVVNQMGGLSMTLPSSTFKWTLEGKSDIEFMFQEKQPIEVRNDGRLLSIYYINKHKRKAKNHYDIECQDAMGVLEESTFSGKVYSNFSAKQIVLDILDGQFHAEFDIPDALMTGAIYDGLSKRAALQQVLFAWGAHASTDGINGIRIFSLDQTAEEIPTDRTYLGAESEMAAIRTAVSVTARAFTPNASGAVTIGGAKYNVTESIYTVVNPNVTGNAKENTTEVTAPTMVSPAIGQATAQRLFDYEENRLTSTAKVVWDGERLGELLEVPNAWGSTVTGTLQKMEITLSNTVAAKLTIRGA